MRIADSARNKSGHERFCSGHAGGRVLADVAVEDCLAWRVFDFIQLDRLSFGRGSKCANADYPFDEMASAPAAVFTNVQAAGW